MTAGGVDTYIHNPSSLVTNLFMGKTTFRWYVTNTTCSAFDEVDIWNMSNEASFTYSINGLTVTFNNNSTQYIPYVYTYTWNFGYGSEITQDSYIPTTEHTYATAGTYTVTLTVQGAICSDQHSEQIVVTSLGNVNQTTKLFPNPPNTSITIDNSLLVEEISIYESQGKLLMSMKPKGSKIQIDISHLAPGVYYLKLSGKDTTTVHKIIKN